MKSLKYSLVAAIFATLATTSLHAQTIDMRANVPFDFHAGRIVMPAGKYLIHEHDAVVILHEEDGAKASDILLTNGARGPEESWRARLVFTRYGSEYFLKEIWGPSGRDGRETRPTPQEKELARRGNVPTLTEVTVSK